MTYSEVIHAVNAGKPVCWHNDLYSVKHDIVCNEYIVVCRSNGFTNGIKFDFMLNGQLDYTLNNKAFYVKG
jgi:hypothetical protein